MWKEGVARMRKRDKGEKARQTEALRRALKAAMDAAGINAHALSLQIGRAPTYISDFVSDAPKKASVGAGDLSAIERVLGLPQGELSLIVDQRIPSVPAEHKTVLRKIPISEAMPLPISVPIRLFYRVNFLTGGLAMDQSSVVDFIKGLEITEESFAVRMPDDTMRPKFAPGDILLVQTDVPCSTGNYVLIETKKRGAEAEGFVRRYSGRTDDGVIVESLNPPAEYKITFAEFVRISRITVCRETN